MTTKMMVTGIAVAAAGVVQGHGPVVPGQGPGHVSPRPPSVPVVAAATAVCRADQIGPIPAIRQGVASGNLVLTVAVTNQKAPTCRLDAYPVLWHTEPGHVPVPVPIMKGGDGGHVVLAPGEYGIASFSRTDTYVYPPTAPACAHPAHYHGLALGVGGKRFSLPGVAMDVPCGAVSAQWL
jgi:hypothetical protein